MRTWRFDGILSWVMITGIIVVGLTIVSLNLLDRYVIEEAAAHNLHFAFLRASAAVSRILSNAGDDIHDVKALNEAFQDIFELRPALRRLSVYEVTPDSGALTFSSDPSTVPPMLSEHERSEITAGRSLTRFEGATTDRAWVFIAPILVKDRVVGALRGRFSIGKYDRLIKQERELAKDVGVAAVSITCLVFLALIRMKVHRPISRLLYAIRRAEAGDLLSQRPTVGPSDIQEVANQFNRMLDRVREAIAEKDHLLGEIR